MARSAALSAHLSLLYGLPRMGRLKPYLAGGLGLEQYGTALDVPRFGLVSQHRLAFAINMGGGLEVPVNRHWGIRTDARLFEGFGPFAPAVQRCDHSTRYALNHTLEELCINIRDLVA